jgi:hypothetical protein
LRRFPCNQRVNDTAQYGEAPEHAAYGEEFMRAMSFFTRHSLAGGSTSLKVSTGWAGLQLCCVMV